ncbi:tetratricopeptide repeat protein [Scytonema sp. NUACC26]|uniref:tetratricopeptide repeat protein n=1 Tax=Scytonema sp. NUACC26 TaxID=3140176 RepID=UPI0034DBA86B
MVWLSASIFCLNHSRIGNYKQALKYYQLSLPIVRSFGNRYWEEKNLRNIGSIYYNLKQYDRALDYYQQALSLTKKLDNLLNESKALNSVGVTYYALGDYSLAIKFFEEALVIDRKIGDGTGIKITMDNIDKARRALKAPKNGLLLEI